ncbi:MAG: hypothetical protein MUC96_13145 [Myxococcaceae bacterium]|jgi:hypothetical protein|nr:hypothetical protein [Myxococcaceae bacterium]
MSSMPVSEVLELIRGAPNPEAGWRGLLAICRAAEPSALWATLPAPDVAADVTSASSWLRAELARPQALNCTGVYLGLDTLNMRFPWGSNVELGFSTRALAHDVELSWVFQRLTRGRNHLIRGLKRLKRVYGRREWQEHDAMADYLLFLGYSGLVLRDAVRAQAWRGNTVVAWGFHDGDLFSLARADPTGVTVLAA